MSAAKIAELNDHFRRTFTGGRVMMTAAVAALDPAGRAEVLERVRAFTDFTADNDPHREHDFGVVTVKDEQYFWKLEYYDLAMEFGSENPSDPAVTTRVLTVGHMNDY